MSGLVGSSDVWRLLADGGAVVTRELTQEGNVRLSISKYNPLLNPRGAMSMAGLLASAAAQLAPTAIVAWEDLEDALLAFAVGAELGLPVIRAFDVEGLVRHGGRFPEAPRGVLVTDAVREGKAIEALKALLPQEGGVLSGVVSAVRLVSVVVSLDIKSLVSASDGPIVED